MLILAATPIGNLGDASRRLREVLATAGGTHGVYTVTVAAVDDRLNRA